MNKSGKTTVAKSLCGLETTNEYFRTEEIEYYSTIFKVGNVPYSFEFHDINGSFLEDTTRRYAITVERHYSSGKIYLFLTNAEDEDEIDFLRGYFKSFGAEYFETYHEIIILTHVDCVEDNSNALRKIRSFTKDTPIWEINAHDPKQIEDLKIKLIELLIKAKYEHPELFEGCEAKKKK